MAFNPQESSSVEVDISGIYAKCLHSRKLMHKVVPQLREVGQQSHPSVYDPVMVSLGPYHHGKPELHQAEEFKHLCLDWCTGGSETTKNAMFLEIFNMIDRIRSCYAEVSVVDKYDDRGLALMMLLDASFILNFMEFCACSIDRRAVYRERFKCMGLSPSLTMTARDIFVLENQIPLFVLDLFIRHRVEEEDEEQEETAATNEAIEAEVEEASEVEEATEATEAARVAVAAAVAALEAAEVALAVAEKEREEKEKKKKKVQDFLQRFFNFSMPSELEPLNIPGENEAEPPIHLLDAYRRVVIRKLNRGPDVQQQPSNYLLSRLLKKTHRSLSSFRSVMDLKAKGIKFRPSLSDSFRDVQFKSHAIFAELQLPVITVSSKLQVNLSNMIAFEMSPNGPSNIVVLSYVILMKSLIQKPADVKELQEQGIFRANRFVHPDEVVQLFKTINTLGTNNQVTVHKELMQKVDEHCNYKTKTWMAELIQGKLSNPWTIIALLAATAIIALTVIQVHYAIHPAK